MSGTSGLGSLLIAAGALILGFASRPVLGLPPDEAATIAILAGIGLLMTARVIDAFRQRGTLGIHALILWSLAFGGLVTMFVQREASLAIVDRFIGEVAAGRAVDNGLGEVVVARRADGSFTLAGHVNGRGARFVFDTGASTVVLTADTAEAVGLDLEKLNFSIPVATANGRMLAAPVTLSSLAIGSIVERRVDALVARPGLLRDNLLGLTFLDRLASYEVRRNRLILRAGT